MSSEKINPRALKTMAMCVLLSISNDLLETERILAALAQVDSGNRMYA